MIYLYLMLYFDVSKKSEQDFREYEKKTLNLTTKHRYKGNYISNLRRTKRSYSTFKVRRVGHEEIPLIQGKEQQLQFAGAAVRRYPMSKVRETQVRR